MSKVNEKVKSRLILPTYIGAAVYCRVPSQVTINQKSLQKVVPVSSNLQKKFFGSIEMANMGVGESGLKYIVEFHHR